MNAVIIFGAKYVIFLIVVLAIVCFFMIEKSRRRELIIFAVITLPLAFVLAKISSLLYYDPRPFVAGQSAGGFVPLIPHAADNGFPSDHMLLASTASVIIFRFKKNWGILLFALAFVVGISRVLAGVHHFVDIFGSVTVVIVAFFLASYLLKRFPLKKA